MAAGAMAPSPSAQAVTLALAADRALARLDDIESPLPPFAVVPARALLAGWFAPVAAESRRPWQDVAAHDATDEELAAAA